MPATKHLVATQFPKGVSGNPSGGSKVSLEFQVACQETLAQEKCGIEKLVVIAQNDRHPKQLDAVTLLLAYAYGKPMQPVTVEGGGVTVNQTNVNVLTQSFSLEELRLMLAEARRKQAQE